MRERFGVQGLVVLAAALWFQAATSAQLGGLEGAPGFVASFFEKDAYVGQVQVDLFRANRQSGRVTLGNLSIAVPEGAGWLLAQPRSGRIETLEHVWFVRDPHRFTVWHKAHGVPPKTTVVFAELKLYRSAAAANLPALVKQRKQREFGIADVTIQRVDTQIERIGRKDCARYAVDLEDRRAPPGFDKIPFLVSIAGRVCLEPDAPGLAVDAGHARRRQPIDPVLQPDLSLDAVVDSVTLGQFTPRIAEDLFVTGDELQFPAAGESLQLAAPRLVGTDLWAFQKGRDPEGLTHFDASTGRPVEKRPGAGRLLGATQRVIWVVLYESDGHPSASHQTVRRIDVADGSVTNFDLDCKVVGQWTFDATDDDVWLPCSQFNRALLRRIGSGQGDVPVAVDLPEEASAARRLGSQVWAKLSLRPCRLVQIDQDSLRIIRTVRVTSDHCSDMTLAGGAMWLTTFGKSPQKLIKLDTASGRTVGTVVLPKGRSVASMVSGAGALWVSTEADHVFSSVSQLATSQAELLEINLQSSQISRRIPTGSRFRVFHADDDGVWLYDPSGAFLKIRLK